MVWLRGKLIDLNCPEKHFNSKKTKRITNLLNFKIMKTKLIGILVIILSLSTSCMMMTPIHTTTSMHSNHHNHNHDGSYIDLVCGTEISINDAVKYNHQEKVYYFDTDECKTVFQKNPDRFIIDNNVNGNKLISTAVITGDSLFMLGMMGMMLF